jgi:hypothetical protein
MCKISYPPPQGFRRRCERVEEVGATNDRVVKINEWRREPHDTTQQPFFFSDFAKSPCVAFFPSIFAGSSGLVD